MGKNVYSMVLSDEVVALIDDVALKKGESRSQLVNEILAKYVGYDTTEKRIQEILQTVVKESEAYRRMRIVQRQQSAIDFLSALNYKYNPRVTYSVELFGEDENSGVLKIALRTTSPSLLLVINEFFNSFIIIEQKYLKNVRYAVIEGKLVRKLDFSKIQTSNELAIKLTEYVNNIDRLINIYISDYPFGTADVNLEKNYLLIKDDIIF